MCASNRSGTSTNKAHVRYRGRENEIQRNKKKQFVVAATDETDSEFFYSDVDAEDGDNDIFASNIDRQCRIMNP
jgi:hypothetical protein